MSFLLIWSICLLVRLNNISLLGNSLYHRSLFITFFVKIYLCIMETTNTLYRNIYIYIYIYIKHGTLHTPKPLEDLSKQTRVWSLSISHGGCSWWHATFPLSANAPCFSWYECWSTAPPIYPEFSLSEW
jgi:hypothetical protein